MYYILLLNIPHRFTATLWSYSYVTVFIIDYILYVLLIIARFLPGNRRTSTFTMRGGKKATVIKSYR
jgi:hypothetical protein